MVKSGWPLALRLFAYRTFVRCGWQVAVLDRMLNQSLRFADVPIVCDLSDTEAAARLLRERFGDPEGILTLNDSGLVATALLAEALGLRFLPVSVARRAIDKREQRRAFAAAGLIVPRWGELASPAEAAGAVQRWGPTVIKPVDRAAGAGVRLALSEPEAATAWGEAARESHSGRVIGEEYVTGREVSVESIASEGRHHVVCVTDKVITQGPRFVEIAHTVPSAVTDAERAGATAAALTACQALRLDWGAAHTEVKLTERGPVVVEVNARLAGDCIVDLVDLALGINMYELVGRQALGAVIGVEHLAPTRAGAASICFRPCSPGRFLAARSALEAAPPEWLVELSVTAQPGSLLGEPLSNADRLGYAIALGGSPDAAARRAREAMDTLEVSIESPGVLSRAREER